MLLSLVAAFAVCVPPAEKIAPGLTYREENDLSIPLSRHILEFTPGKGTTMSAELAGGTVFSADATKGRMSVSDIAQAIGGVAGINGDFFPFTGDPVGLMMHEGKLLSLPYIAPKTGVVRPALLWNDRKSAISNRLKYHGSVTLGDSEPLSIDGLDELCKADKLCLDGPEAGLCLASAQCLELLIEMPKDDGPPMARVRSVVHDQAALVIPKGCAALVATGSKARVLDGLEPGDSFAIDSELDVLSIPATEAVGGGPMLVHNGKSAIDAAQEGFDVAFANNLHPRTAVGRRKNGQLVFVVVDGRQSVSAGTSLGDLAKWFVAEGCTEAMNLDGGNSSAMCVLGKLVSHPSDGVQRPVANAIVFKTSAH